MTIRANTRTNTRGSSDAAEPSVERLARALDAEGGRFDVEARGRLAVLRPSAAPAASSAPTATGALGEPDRRARIVALAREHGFTHAALEL